MTDDTRIRSKGSGIGLRNVHQRIQLYFGKAYGLKIMQRAGSGNHSKDPSAQDRRSKGTRGGGSMTQKRNHIAIWAVIFAAVVLLAVSYYYGAIRGTSDSPSVYSVILYQNTDNEWTTLLEGIRQAEEDFGLKVNYVNMSTGDTAQEQAELIRREIDSGVSGILFAAVDSKALGDALKDDNIQIPLVALETGVSGISSSNYFSITGDDYGMGQALGQKILKDMEEQGGQRVVTVIREYMERDSVSQRYEGLVDQLKKAEPPVEIQDLSRKEGDFSLRLYIGTNFQKCGQYIAALDKVSTEEAAAAWQGEASSREQEGKTFRIYGIGNTLQTVTDLDNGLLQGFVYQNEFNMGYEGIQTLVDKEKKGYFTEQVNIKYKLVTQDTLYESDNERLLFPSI